jgi:hypothetical protein
MTRAIGVAARSEKFRRPNDEVLRAHFPIRLKSVGFLVHVVDKMRERRLIKIV